MVKKCVACKIEREDEDFISKAGRKDLLQCIRCRQMKSKSYYEKNKENINKKFDCACGGKYTNMNWMAHYKTKRHLKYTYEN